MFRNIFRCTGTLCGAVVAPEAAHNPGWERVKNIFTKDEYDCMAPEMVTILQTTFFSAFAGACYGGFTHSREAYLRFIERNDATTFVDHFEAKKKLQDSVTLSYAKGAWKWGWRVSVFSGLYVTTVILCSAYRGEMKLLDFVIAGTVAGGLYRIKYGVRGIVAGSTLGLILGLFAGSISIASLKLLGKNYDDIYNWHNDNLNIRNRQLAEGLDAKYHGEDNLQFLKEHDSLLNNRMEP